MIVVSIMRCRKRNTTSCLKDRRWK